MPALDNPRHEKFAQELAKGRSQYEAYIEAGYSKDTAMSASSRLLRNVKIAERVEQIKAAAAVRVEVTAASLIEEAEEVRRAALEAGQFSAAVAAIREKGVLAGVRVEKNETKRINDVRKLSDAELDAVIADLLAREAVEAGGSRQSH